MMLHPQFSILAEGSLLDHVLPHTLFRFQLAGHDIGFTNHMLMISVVAVLMLVVFIPMGAAARNPIPTGFRNFFEAILSYLRTDVFRPALGPHTDRFVPYLWTVFFFILFANLVGLVPTGAILAFINPHLKHYGGTATGNLAVTAALALLAFATIHVSGIIQQIRIQMDPSLDPHHAHDSHGHGPSAHDEPHAAHGVAGPESGADLHVHAHQHPGRAGKPLALAVPVGFLMYWKNFVPSVPLYLWPLMFLLELIGALVKPFSLAVRLFANMLAGHLILGALIGLGVSALAAGIVLASGVSVAVVAGCAALDLLELFVAFLQAYIFTFLTTLFIAAAVAPEH